MTDADSKFVTELTKAQIRSKILLKLKTQKEEYRNQKSKVIKDKLLRNKVFRKAKIVMFYIAFGGEVDTEEMIKEAKKAGKLICVPICKKDRETMHRVDDRRVGSCVEQHVFGLSKAQEKRAKKEADKQPDLF